MKLLIIGGSGIISGELCKVACDRGDEVTILNRGKRPEQLDPRAKLIIGDVKLESAEELAEKITEDYDVVADYLSYSPADVQKMLKVVEDRCTQYVFISSATAYRDIGDQIYTEDVPVGDCYWIYAQMKADCEHYLEGADLRCRYTIVRPYVTYGRTRLPYQVAPLQYYTIIDRIKKHKPIMICGKDTRCTVTFAPEFAVGVYGLLLNEKAYGEAYHVTTHHTTTWAHIVTLVAEKLGEPLTLIDVPKEYLLAHKEEIGIDVNEILGDKSRNMIFDNRKIREAVPEFVPETSIDQGIDVVLEYFSKEEHQIVNEKWDAALDELLDKYNKN